MGNCSFIGADRHIYETNISGLGSLATANVEVDLLTTVLIYSLPKLYHWAVVDPLYRLLGRWVKVNYIMRCFCNASTKLTSLETRRTCAKQ